MPYRILLVDDSELVRHSLRSCFEQTVDWAVCGEAGDGREAIDQVRLLDPDLVIMDLSMPNMNGLDAAREIRRAYPNVLMLMFTTFNSPALERQALAVGCSGVVSKSDVQSLFLSIGNLLDFKN